MPITKKEERNYAQILYVNENLTAKEIAKRVGVTQKTMGRWLKAGKWDQLRKSMLVTKQKMIVMLYDQLEAINNDIAKRDSPIPTSKEADTISKLTTSIQRLEVEASIGETIEVAKSFIDFVRGYDLELAKDITDHFDSYIQYKMK